MDDDNRQWLFLVGDKDGNFSEKGDRWSLVNSKIRIAPKNYVNVVAMVNANKSTVYDSDDNNDKTKYNPNNSDDLMLWASKQIKRERRKKCHTNFHLTWE